LSLAFISVAAVAQELAHGRELAGPWARCIEEAPANELDLPRQLRTVRGVSQTEAEALFAEALAAIYFPQLQEVRLLSMVGPGQASWATGQAPAVQASTSAAYSALAAVLESSEDRGTVETVTTLRSFIAGSAAELGGAGSAASLVYLVKVPFTSPATEPAPTTSLTGAPKAGDEIEASYIYEDFEGDVWSRWSRSDTTGTLYTWGIKSCDSHYGNYSADAVRGGSSGALLGCSASYPPSVETWMYSQQCISSQPEWKAWLELYLKTQMSGSDNDYFKVAVLNNAGQKVGWSFSGTWGGTGYSWYRLVFNLKQWTGIGDLTARSCNTLYLGFHSGSSTPGGYGARVDDLKITYGADATVSGECAIVADPKSGPAPLTVAFRPIGDTATDYYWDFGDGVTSTATEPVHTYCSPGSYEASLWASSTYEQGNANQAILVSTGSTCTLGSSTMTTAFGPMGGSGSVDIKACGGNCTWAASSTASWIAIQGSSTGSGSGSVAFTVSPHSGSTNRTGSILVAGKETVVTQFPSPGSTILAETFDGSFPSPGWTALTGRATTWGRSTYRMAGAASAWCAGAGSHPSPPGGPYAPNMGEWLRYGPFSLSDVTEAMVEFDLWLDSEPENDQFYWGLSLDESQYYGFYRSGHQAGWQHVSMSARDITRISVVGKPQVWLGLKFGSDWKNEYEGAYVDNVILRNLTACSFSLSGTSKSFPSSGGFGAVGVSASGASCAWSAISNENWITITSGASGSGSGQVSFSVAPNPGADRSGTMTVADQIYTVNQDALSCSFTVSPMTQSFLSAGGYGEVEVTASVPTCTWGAVSNASWITITSGASGSGSGQVGFNVGSNPGPPRTGTMTIAGQTLTVNQAEFSCSYSISTLSASFTVSGGTGNLGVTAPAGCSWSAASQVAWITITAGSSGSGSGTISYAVAQNTTAGGRSGTITIADQTFTVNQDGFSCSYAVSPTTISAPADGGAWSVIIETGSSCTWSATSSTGWLHFQTTASGVGDGSVVITVDPNTGNARTGSLAVQGQTVTVQQAGTTSGCAFSYWIPVVSHVPGSNNSQWRTDLGLLNRGDAVANVTLTLYSTGTPASRALTQASLAQAIIPDAAQWIASGFNGTGALQVCSSQPVSLTSRTYNLVSGQASCYPSGTFGQFYGAVQTSGTLGLGETGWIAGLTENASFRCNIGVVNTGPTGATVRVTLRGVLGEHLGSYYVDLNPGQLKQENRPFFSKAGQTMLGKGYAKIEVVSGTGVLAYASVIDNLTNDPVTIPMEK